MAWTPTSMSTLALASALISFGCAEPEVLEAGSFQEEGCAEGGGKADSAIGYSELNLRAGTMVLYESPDVRQRWLRLEVCE